MGGYTTLMESLLPGTLYYIRAYALTAKGEVYYGNQVSVRTADACFIATASFGTLLHPCVGILRDFRDAFLVNHSAGRWLVDWYYTLSPPLADFIAGNAVLRFVVRALLDSGNRSMRQLLSVISVDKWPLPAEFQAVMINMNTPEDYERVLEKRKVLCEQR